MEMMREIKGKKATQGRKKIEIKKIEKQSNRQVTFSKRRVGLFKKASELCILSGAHASIIVLSHGKRVFTFGHPTPDAVLDRFLTGGGDDHDHHPAAAVVPNIGDYNKHYSDVSKELDAEKKRRVEEEAGGVVRKWWQDSVEGKGVEELEQYEAALDELRKNISLHADDLMVLHSSSSYPPPVPAAIMEAAPRLVNSSFHTQLLSNGYGFGQGGI